MPPSSRAPWRVLSIVVAAVAFAGLAALIAFMLPLTIDDAAAWSGVIGGLLAYLAFAGGLVLWLYRRAAKPGLAENGAGDRVTFGHQNPESTRSNDPVRQLPMEVAEFVGRGDIVSTAAAVFTSTTGPRVVNLHGLPGVGKTALGVHLVRLLPKEFSNLQLYFDLREGTIDGALTGALLALGAVASELPADVAARSATYRSLLRYRDAVVVIDNARPALPLGHLIPGDWNSIVIVISWEPLVDLPSAVLISVLPLVESESVDLLHRVSRRPASLSDSGERRMADLVGHLPLALTVSAGLAKAHPDWSWNDLADRVTDQVGQLRTEKLTAVTASLNLAYADLDQASATAYRQLGRLPRPVAPVSLVLALAGVVYDTAWVIDQLVDRQLLHRDGDSFRMHSLLWARARELAAFEDPTIRAATDARLVDWTVGTLRTTYIRQLRAAVETTLILGHRRSHSFKLVDMYVDAPVVVAGSPQPLWRALTAHPRILVAGVAGAGKTTMVNHLCLGEGSPAGDQTVPILLYARDVHNVNQGVTIESLVLGTMSDRFGIEFVPEALDTALTRTRIMVIVDGFDELANRDQPLVAAAVVDFVSRRQMVPILVTTRGYDGLSGDFPGFTVAELPSWTPELMREYAAKLHATGDGGWRSPESLVELVTSVEDLGSFGTPLIEQIAATSTRDRYPDTDLPQLTGAGLMSLIARIIDELLLDREFLRIRGTPEAGRTALEHIAWIMQTTPGGRTQITASELLDATKKRDYEKRPIARLIEASEGGPLLQVTRSDDGEQVTFSHSAYREFLAASYLARQPVGVIVESVTRHWRDASWSAVLRMALYQRSRTEGSQFRTSMINAIEVAGVANADNLASTLFDKKA